MPHDVAVREPGEPDETNLIEVSYIKAVNRFARQASVTFWDPDAESKADWFTFRPVEIDVGDTRDWAGFAIEQDWDDAKTRIDFLSGDFWLKKRQVFLQVEEEQISDVLEQIVSLTPLQWEPDNVEVVDDVEITREYRGESIKEVLDDIRELSDREYYGANNDFEFFFRPTQRDRAAFDLTEGNFFRPDWDDDDRRVINQVRLFYDGGDKAVVENNLDSQGEIGENIGVGSGVIAEKTAEYPEITELDAARRKAKAILRKRDTLEVGEIPITLSGAELSPGEVIDVVDPRNGIEGEFVIAQVTVNSRDFDQVTVVENREGAEDIVVEIADEIERQDVKNINPDADVTEVVELGFEFALTFDIEAFEQTFLDDEVFRFGHFGEDLGSLETGGKLGDGLATRTRIT